MTRSSTVTSTRTSPPGCGRCGECTTCTREAPRWTRTAGPCPALGPCPTARSPRGPRSPAWCRCPRWRWPRFHLPSSWSRPWASRPPAAARRRCWATTPSWPTPRPTRARTPATRSSSRARRGTGPPNRPWTSPRRMACGSTAACLDTSWLAAQWSTRSTTSSTSPRRTSPATPTEG